MKKKLWNKNTGMTFLVIFLFTFMLLIFGPAEIFFANAAEFEFVYGEFAGYLAVLAVAAALFGTIILSLLPKKTRNVILSILFGISVAGYFQVMFWNKGLDLLGLNPEGYQINQERVWWNLIFWLLVIGGCIVLFFRKENIWRKITVYVALFLLCIQGTALISLMLTANESAYRHPDGEWRLSGENQLTVSADKNVIVFVIDFFGNQLLEDMREGYPGSTDFLHDFTEYTNTDSTYFGTYPSLAHMVTGCEVDMSKRVNDWLAQSWSDKRVEKFYDDLHNANYVTNLYTDSTAIICGTNSAEILDGKVSNILKTSDEIDVFYKLLFKTMTKMSCYRMLPEIIKPYFYTDMSEYADIVKIKDNPVLHENYYFYDALLKHRLTLDKKSDYLIIQHLMGTHECTTGEDGYYTQYNDSRAVTARGCMTILEEYLNQLKELGVYDTSAIIITADHGDVRESPVLFVKAPEEQHEKIIVNDAPVSHREFLPTLAEYAGLDHTQYGSGKSIHDYLSGQERERIYWTRDYIDSYQEVPNYSGEKTGSCNVYRGFQYIGSMKDIDWDKTDYIIQMVDSFF